VVRSVERSLRGTVEEFDAHVGLGAVRGDDGKLYPFHCAQIADGTRTIPVGTTVRACVVAGQLGRWEAAAIEAC
jgi:CspA family cold shock protein